MTCTECNAGKYSNTEGAESFEVCNTCPLFSDSNINRTDCVCNAGYFNIFDNDQMGGCTACMKGYWKQEQGNQNCNKCDQNMITQETASTSATSCVPCATNIETRVNADADYFEYSGNKYYNLECVCVEGYYFNGDSCEACPAGKFKSSTDNSERFKSGEQNFELCTECPVGKHQSVEGQPKCEPCSQLEYQDQPGQEKCKIKPQNAVVETISVSGGIISVRWKCKPGYIENNAGDGCQACAAGKYAGGYGWDDCKHCSIGTYSQNAGSLGCSQCTKGKFNDESGMSICKTCTDSCIDGQYKQEDCNSEKDLQCADCRCDEDAINSGQGWNVDEDGNINQTCATNTNGGTVQPLCNQCPNDYYSDNGSCKRCNDQYEITIENNVCVCKEGYYLKLEYHRFVTNVYCKACEPGKYKYWKGDSYVCADCLKDHYSDLSAATGCTECPTGKFSVEGSTGCTGCPANTFFAREEIIQDLYPRLTHNLYGGEISFWTYDATKEGTSGGPYEPIPITFPTCMSCTQIYRHTYTNHFTGSTIANQYEVKSYSTSNGASDDWKTGCECEAGYFHVHNWVSWPSVECYACPANLFKPEIGNHECSLCNGKVAENNKGVCCTTQNAKSGLYNSRDIADMKWDAYYSENDNEMLCNPNACENGMTFYNFDYALDKKAECCQHPDNFGCQCLPEWVNPYGFDSGQFAVFHILRTANEGDFKYCAQNICAQGAYLPFESWKDTLAVNPCKTCDSGKYFHLNIGRGSYGGECKVCPAGKFSNQANPSVHIREEGCHYCDGNIVFINDFPVHCNFEHGGGGIIGGGYSIIGDS
tara:strand:+ start:1642 stop:4095 length:2454 start_codon:yes stop_codon:yes gene_type:complete